MERHAVSADERGSFGKCVPLAAAERFHGTWATDFEFNEFYNGKILAADQVWQFPEPSTALVIEGSELEKYTVDDLANVLEVEFIGRRTVCNFTEPYRHIVVDEVIDTHIIEARPSEW